MKPEPCDFCDGTLERRRVSVVRGRGRRYALIEGVPALVCRRCGMRYYDAEVVRGMERILRSPRGGRRKIAMPVTKFVEVA